VFGDQTAAAVLNFQREHGLEVDGVIGPQTKRALKDAGAPAWLFARPPVIAIPLSDPHKLLPGRDDETQRLIALVKSMGCEPVLVPPCADVALPRDQAVRRNALAAMTQTLHGVLGPGGADVDPDIYGAVRSPLTGPTNFARDRFEADFAQAARMQPLFMFGICRSHQLWNAAFGGKLVQDVRAEGRSAITQNQSELGIPWDQPFIVRWPDGTLRFENRVNIVQQSLLGAQVLLGSMLTNSYHHQQVDVPGEGMHVVGTVRDEELAVDNIEITEDWNVMSTQFHPEAMQHDPAQKALLGMLGRRAQIFWLMRSLQNEGGAVNDATLLARMAELPAGTFTPADEAWVRTELSTRLAQRAMAR
jgi:putative glutamine amidotransferase